MSTVLGIQGDGWCVLGADSQSSLGNRKSKKSRAEGKLVRRQKLIIGVVGDVRALDLVSIFKPPVTKHTGRNYLVKDFIPALIDSFIKHYYLQVTQEEDDLEGKAVSGSVFLVARQGKLYRISQDFSASADTRGLFAIGSGEDYALGALAVIWKTGGTIEEARVAVRQALKVAAGYDVYTSGPFYTYSQERSQG